MKLNDGYNELKCDFRWGESALKENGGPWKTSKEQLAEANYSSSLMSLLQAILIASLFCIWMYLCFCFFFLPFVPHSLGLCCRGPVRSARAAPPVRRHNVASFFSIATHFFFPKLASIHPPICRIACQSSPLCWFFVIFFLQSLDTSFSCTKAGFRDDGQAAHLLSFLSSLSLSSSLFFIAAAVIITAS